MVLFAPLLAKWAIAFGPAEYFVLMVFAIVCLGGMAGDKPLKTLLAALLGLFLSCVGIDANSGVYRFTGDSIHLADGIQFVVLVLGLFSVSEILLLLEKTHHGQEAVQGHRADDVQLQGSRQRIPGQPALRRARLRPWACCPAPARPWPAPWPT
ncbi:tripartite tricarboxylate transporter TctA [Pseudomonas aeruginosa]|nr:tripartite tricarboxylate transporter TctA [Pseudomonas aeruginosa]